MVDALVARFDAPAASAVRAAWQRLSDAGVPPADRSTPHVTLAVASAVPPRVRADLRRELRLLTLPELWLAGTGIFPTGTLHLAAVVDAELLAVHSAVHDVLAGRVREPRAHYLPGGWVPHCTLAQDLTGDQLATAVRALHPLEPVRARLVDLALVDTRTGATERVAPEPALGSAP